MNRIIAILSVGLALGTSNCGLMKATGVMKASPNDEVAKVAAGAKKS